MTNDVINYRLRDTKSELWGKKVKFMTCEKVTFMAIKIILTKKSKLWHRELKWH